MTTEALYLTADTLIAEARRLFDRHGETLHAHLPADEAEAVGRLIAKEHDGCEYRPGMWDLWSEDAWRIDLRAHGAS